MALEPNWMIVATDERMLAYVTMLHDKTILAEFDVRYYTVHTAGYDDGMGGYSSARDDDYIDIKKFTKQQREWNQTKTIPKLCLYKTDPAYLSFASGAPIMAYEQVSETVGPATEKAIAEFTCAHVAVHADFSVAYTAVGDTVVMKAFMHVDGQEPFPVDTLIPNLCRKYTMINGRYYIARNGLPVTYNGRVIESIPRDTRQHQNRHNPYDRPRPLTALDLLRGEPTSNWVYAQVPFFTITNDGNKIAVQTKEVHRYNVDSS